MRFEYDPDKSDANYDKHEIDFEEAQELWEDPGLVEYGLEYGGERRFAIVAKLADGYWTAICTMRRKRVRIISVRRATRKEVSLYDKTNDD